MFSNVNVYIFINIFYLYIYIQKHITHKKFHKYPSYAAHNFKKLN